VSSQFCLSLGRKDLDLNVAGGEEKKGKEASRREEWTPLFSFLDGERGFQVRTEGGILAGREAIAVCTLSGGG